MFKDSKREDLEQDYGYARDRLLGAMAKTLELLLAEHVANIIPHGVENARKSHRATTLLGGLGYCIEHFSEAEQKLRSYRRG